MNKYLFYLCLSFLLFFQINAMQVSEESVERTNDRGANVTVESLPLEPHLTNSSVYVLTDRRKADVLKKSAVTVSAQNQTSVTQAFIDALGDTLRETGTSTKETINQSIDEFKATINTQKEILGRTAKDVITIFSNAAKGLFSSVSDDFANILDAKVKNIKFANAANGDTVAIQRTPKHGCCAVLLSVVGLLKEQYDYLERESGNSGNETEV